MRVPHIRRRLLASDEAMALLGDERHDITCNWANQQSCIKRTGTPGTSFLVLSPISVKIDRRHMLDCVECAIAHWASAAFVQRLCADHSGVEAACRVGYCLPHVQHEKDFVGKLVKLVTGDDLAWERRNPSASLFFIHGCSPMLRNHFIRCTWSF